MWHPSNVHRKPVWPRRSAPSTRRTSICRSRWARASSRPWAIRSPRWIPNNAELTGSIRERILRESATLYAPEGAGPWVDRSRKSDQLTAQQPKRNDAVAAKGDRLARAAGAAQAEAEPVDGPDVPSQQVAAVPSIEGTAGVPAPFDIESDLVVAAEKQLSDAVDAGGADTARRDCPTHADADQSADRGADASGAPPRWRRPARSSQAQSSKRSQRSRGHSATNSAARSAVARDARQKAEKVARSKDAAKSSRVQQAAKPSPAKVAAAPDVPPQTEAIELSQGIAGGLHETTPTVQADAQIQPSDTASSKGFTLASAGDYRIGIDSREFERVTAPARRAGNNVEQSPKARRMRSTPPSRWSTPRARHRNKPRSCSSARIRWARRSAASNLGVRVPSRDSMAGRSPALPPGSMRRGSLRPCRRPSRRTASVLLGVPDQSISKDPNAQGGQSVAPKGEVTGADQAADDTGRAPRPQRREERAPRRSSA